MKRTHIKEVIVYELFQNRERGRERLRERERERVIRKERERETSRVF